AESGWYILSTGRPTQPGEWMVLVPMRTVEEVKAFWTQPFIKNPHMVWYSRAAELTPYWKEVPNE
ncbi:MAG: hypothetical protein QXM12_07300, partial [Nitrososphaerota archaeon]